MKICSSLVSTRPAIVGSIKAWPLAVVNNRFSTNTPNSITSKTGTWTRRKKKLYEHYSEAKLEANTMAATTSLDGPFQYSRDEIKKLSPWGTNYE